MFVIDVVAKQKILICGITYRQKICGRGIMTNNNIGGGVTPTARTLGNMLQTIVGIRIGKYQIKIDKVVEEYKTVKEVIGGIEKIMRSQDS